MPGPRGTKQYNRVFTSPLAVIRLSGSDVNIGKIQTLQFTENIGRQEVRQLGSLYSVEIPAVSISCSFTAQSALIDFSRLGDVPNTFWPVTDDPVEFANSLIFADVEVDIEVYTLIPGDRGRDPYQNELITSTDLHSMGVARNCVLESRSFNINNDQIAITNISGRYLKPIIPTVF